MIDYEAHIYRDVLEYNCEHGRFPRAIFMSRKLCEMIAWNYELKEYDTSGGVVYMYHGIEIKPYSSDKLEYYLVASGRELD